MLNKLVIENFRHRPLRTLLSVAAIGIEVMLMLTLVGLSRGVLEEYSRRAKGVGADIIMRPSGSSVMSFSTASIPVALLDYVRKQPHVTMALGNVIIGIGGLNSVSGIDLDAFARMSGFQFVEGGPIRADNEILIDQDYAQQNQKKAGDTIKVLNRDWRIAGVIESGKLSRVFMPIARLQDLSATTGKLSQIFIKVDRPENVAPMVESLKKQFEGYPIYSLDQFVSLYSINNVPGLRPFIFVIVVLAVIVGFLVVSLTMYTVVLERTREIGILKALGASQRFILGLLLRETLLLAACGIVVGIMMSYLSSWAISAFVPADLKQVIVPDWWVYAGAIAIIGAMLGALYPGLKAARQDAIEALSYE